MSKVLKVFLLFFLLFFSFNSIFAYSWEIKIISRLGYICASRVEKHLSKYCSPLNTGIIIDIKGSDIFYKQIHGS